jgi:nitrogenase molybdenum-iron protein alpha chain
MPFIPSKIIAITERRLGTIDAYYGPAQPLIDGYKDGQFFSQRIRTLSQTKPDEITVILKLLHQIKDAVIVVHGARGCSAIQNYYEAFDGKGAPVFTTNLTEDNSIMGAEEVLRGVIEEAYKRHEPKVVFVVTTPIVAINNDDVQTVAANLGEELGIPVIPIYADGFKTKIAANGYDIAFHSFAGYLVPKTVEMEKGLVNVIVTSENKSDVDYLSKVLTEIGLKPNIFPRFSDVKKINNSSNASVTVGLGQNGRVIGEFLEKERQVPFHIFNLPIGISGTTRWLNSVAGKTGCSDEAGKYAKLQEEIATKESVASAGINLNNKKVYISGDIFIALGLADIVKEFGGKVIGLSLTTVDKNTVGLLEEYIKNNGWTFNIHIGDGQAFEQANILSRNLPDIYFGALGQAVHAARLGIPSVCYDSLALYGYDAAINLVKKAVQAMGNRSFVEKLASINSIYSRSSWFGKNPNWYIKQEVG